MSVDFDAAGIRWGTDKASTHHNYLSIYQEILEERKVFRLLELGVAHGKSLFTWAELFPEALIVGVDINKDCRLHQRINIDVVIADSTDPAKMAAVSQLYGPFDVIIDDAIHEPEPIKTAFAELFPRLAPGGVYFIEDMDFEWANSFAIQWGGQVRQGVSKSLIIIERQ